MVIAGISIPDEDVLAIPLKDRIRSRREALGLSAQEVAERVGVSLTQIYRIERGDTRSLQRPTRRAYAQVLGVSEDYLRVRKQDR